MKDKELLELAAKAAGIEIKYMTVKNLDGDEIDRFIAGWNPLTDDGDALRLAVKLRINPDFHDCACCVVAWEFGRDYELDDSPVTERFKDLDFDHPDGGIEGDKNAATRRAIVRAAAGIGKA